ncbi:MAG: hypothetical protein JWP10_1989 [Nocardioidaceae bacterium]|nr:hypothetical protein [Nocardioidaceae bacterium]
MSREAVRSLDMSVRIGLVTMGFPFSSAASYLEWVDMCEDMEVDSLWFSERLSSTEMRLEPIVTMSLIAGRTSRIKFGMNVTVLPLRDPLVLAKQCATLDFLSDGRLLPGFGVGAAKAPVVAATGRTAAGRGRYADEMLQIMTRLWREDHVSFDGEFFQYSDVSISPKPAQAELPAWIGGHTPAAIRRTARYGTGWLAGSLTPTEVGPVIAAIKEATEAEGRHIDDDHFGGGFAFRFGAADDAAVKQAVSDQQLIRPMDPADVVVLGADAMIERARAYVEAGVSKFVLRPVADNDDEMREQVSLLVEHVMPAVHAMST